MACISAALVKPLLSADAGPRVTESPADATTNVGGAASFRVVVTAESAVSYHWYHDDQLVAAATDAILVIPHVANADAGRYQVVAQTAGGGVTSGVATLTVRPASATPIVDLTFHGDPALGGTPTTMLPLADGRVLLATKTGGGSFGTRADLYRLQPDGRIDPAFRVGTAVGEEFPRNIGGAVVSPDPATIWQLIVQPDGRVIVVGSFAFFNGVARSGIARLRTDGTLDETFVPTVSVQNFTSLQGSSTETVAALQPDGKMVVLATSANQVTRLVRLEPDGRADASFVPPGLPINFRAVTVDRAGRILLGTGNPRGGGGGVIALSRDGQLDASFGRVTSDPVLRLYALDNGSVMVSTQYDMGPVFPGTGPVPIRFPVTTFRLRADGSRDPAFATRDSLLTSPPASDGSIFLGGKVIAPDGFTETAVNLGVSSDIGAVNTFASASGGRVWVTGTFSFFNGVNTSRIARLNIVSSENLTPPRVFDVWADKTVVKLGEELTLHVAPVGEGPLTYTWLWPFNTGVRAITNEPTLRITGSTAGERIAYSVRVANSAGAATSRSVTITNEPGDLQITWQPRRVSLTPGRRAVIAVQLAEGAQPDFIEWRRDGETLVQSTEGTGIIFGPVIVQGALGTGVTLDPVGLAQAGTYVVTLRDKVGRIATSDPIVVTVGDSSRFTNLSTRAQVGPGEQAAVLGFVIPSGQSRKVLLRGVGPGLASFGVNGALADPRLDLFNSSGGVLQRNDGWQVTFTGDDGFSRVGAFPLANGSHDTALETELQPGSYTVRLASLSEASGVGLIELYEDDRISDRLFNLSSRVFVGAGVSGSAIAGFAIRGPVNKPVLVRAVGPALAALGIGNPLADPQLEIWDERGNLVRANDDWQDQADALAVASAASSVGAFPFASGSKDAAMLLTLPPGNYSAVVAGKGAAIGTALIEIYETP